MNSWRSRVLQWRPHWPSCAAYTASCGGAGFALRRDLPPRVIAPIVIGLLALIRNNVRAVRDDAEHAVEEPWLVVDDGVGGSGSCRCYGCSRWRSRSGLQVRRCSLAVPMTGGWLGLTVVSDLLVLREKRRELREAEAPAKT